MKRPKILICLTIYCTIFSHAPYWAQSQHDKIEKVFVEFLGHETWTSASVGFCLMDADSETEIYSYQGAKSLIPASSQKIVVAATALEVLGAEHRFVTTLGYDGVITKGVLYGNLVVVGGGDPGLGSERFGDSQSFLDEWVAAVGKAGIKEVRGGIVVDESYLGKNDLAGSTSIEDSGNYYAAGSGSVNYQDNYFVLEFSSENREGGSTSITGRSPHLRPLTTKNEVLASSVARDEAYIYSIPGSEVMVVRGTIPMGRQGFTIRGANHNPGKLLCDDLAVRLNDVGITTGQFTGTFSTVKVLAVHPSEPLTDLVVVMLGESDNSYADCLLKHLGKEINHEPSLKSGAEGLKKYWKNKGVNITGWFQADGSGLSRENGMSARQIAQVLCQSFNLHEELNRGLKTMGPCEFTRVKSGYLNHVRAYAGYVEGKGKTYVFSIICNNYAASANVAREHIEQLFKKMEDTL